MSANNDFMDSLKNSAQEGMNKLGNDMANVGNKMAEMGKNTLNEIISDATTVTTTVRKLLIFDNLYGQLTWHIFTWLGNITGLLPA